MYEEENQSFCKRIKDIDAFGSEITLYYKGKEKSKTYFGSVFTILYSLIYFVIITYKFIRMLKKTDVTFYDSQISPKDPPFMELNNDNFYGAFTLEDPYTYDPFIDETIYTVKAFFKKAVRFGEKWIWEVKEVELEQCNIEKFGKLYREKFAEKPLDRHHCFKNVNFTLEGTFSYDAYSFFYIQFFPCINTTENNNHCKTVEEIDYYLNGTMFTLQMEDIELSPENFKEPTRPRDQDVYTTVGKKLFKELHIYLEIVNIETDLDVFGFEELQNKKVEKFIKYDYENAMTKLIDTDIYKTGESFADITIKLSDNVLNQKRTYVKLVDILGDVGGLMEVVLSLFKIISSFSSDLLFESSLVNSLFEFNLGSKQVFIYNRYKKKMIQRRSLKIGDEINIEKFRSNIKTLSINSQNYTNDELKDSSTKRNMKIKKPKYSINSGQSEKNFIKRRRRRTRTNQALALKYLIENQEKIEINENNKENEENKIPIIKYQKRKKLSSNIPNNNFITNNLNNKEISEISICDKKTINSGSKENEKVTKIKFGRFWVYVFFVCAKRRKNVNAILLNEAMRIITENLDIINVFRKVYSNSQNEKQEVIEMSENCKKQLDSLYYLESNI